MEINATVKNLIAKRNIVNALVREMLVVNYVNVSVVKIILIINKMKNQEMKKQIDQFIYIH